MAGILDKDKGKKILVHGRKQKAVTRTPTSTQDQPEDIEIKGLHLLDIPQIDRELSPQRARHISRYVSTSSFSLLGSSNPLGCDKRPSMLQKRRSHLDKTRGDTVDALNNNRNLSLKDQPKLEHNGFSSDELTLKGRKPFTRRASLPASYLGEYLSVNSIRRRAQNCIVIESDRIDAKMQRSNKVKSKTRRSKLRLPSAEKTGEVKEDEDDSIVNSNGDENSVGNDDVEDTFAKIAVRNM